MPMTFPGESPEYRAARNALLEREVALRREIAAVATQRQALPPGGVIPEDYVFEGMGPDGDPAPIRMSELFEPGKDTLAIYSLMFTPDMRTPCPGCTGLIDSLGRTIEYIRERINFVFVADSALSRILDIKDRRGWFGMPMLSTARNTYNRDYHGITEDGDPVPMLNVFRRDGDVIRHFWGAEIMFEEPEPGQDSRSNDTWDSYWNLLDLTPEGRGEVDDSEIDFETPWPPARERAGSPV